ncbi:AAA family ATPase [Aquibium microcysteis]|uniref:AAA family ATPase n=1 Tax=Aquibium microcysteis TaxID=675281 RepID=UPI00165D2BBE|nr:AAA family ATPase [Aquibium microcysteis]
MKIVQFNAENIKRLVAVEIRPDGNLVEITGRNGQGKTSILDAIWWALDSNKVVQSKPVRDGADSGYVRLDLGEYIVTKKFKVKGEDEFTTTLTVENRDGAKYSSPVELLKSFLGDLTFDPLAFSRMKARDQVTALRAMVPDFDFAAADDANDKDFKARTDVNRTVRDLTARIEAIQVPASAPTERVSAADLLTELQHAMEHNEGIEKERRRRTSIQGRIVQLREANETRREDIRKLEQRIADLNGGIAAAEQAIEELHDELDGVKDDVEPIDTASIRERITTAEEANRYVDRRVERERLEAEAKRQQEISDGLTKAIDDRKAAAAKAVREAKLPVAGLELTEDAVLLNGVPFNQASDAEQLRVSIAVAGAMNPRLRVIRVRDGSLLDDEAMATLRAYADENDMQIWIERVDSSGKVGVVIEDGMVAAAMREAAE